MFRISTCGRPDKVFVNDDLEKLLNADIRMRYLRVQHGEHARELLGVLTFLVGALATYTALEHCAMDLHRSARWFAILAGGSVAGTVIYYFARRTWFHWGLAISGVAIAVWMFL